MRLARVYYAKYPELTERCREHADPELSTEDYAVLSMAVWEAIRDGRPVPAVASRGGITSTTVEARAATCRACDRVKLTKDGEPDIRLTVGGFSVNTVGCQDCGCQALSLIHGKCPLDKWPSKTKE